MKTRLLIIIGIVLASIGLGSFVYVVSVQSQCESLLGDTHYPRPLTLWNCLDYLAMIQESPESEVIDSLKIPNTERDTMLAAGYKLYPGVGWVHPDDLGNQKPIYRYNPNNPGELVLDLDAMIKKYDLDLKIPTEDVPVESVPECDESYPDVCITPYPVDLDCDEISYSNFRVIGNDPHGFDRDNDGIGCES